MQTDSSPFPTPDAGRSQTASVRRGRGVLFVFLALWVAWSGALGWLRVSHPELDHGDITTDSNILNAGENFDREGFWSSWGVPALDTFRADGKTPDYYLTYPPGCYWLHQALKLVGVQELWHFRLVSVFWSSLAVLLFFVVCTRVSGAVLPAAIAATAYMLSRPFAEYSDNLHYLSFSQVTLFATVLGWVGIEQAGTAASRMRWLLFTAAMFTLDSLVTFEHTLFVAAFGFVRIALSRRWGLLLPLMLLGLVPVAVLSARFAINAAAMGGVSDVWAVMQAKLRQRTGASGGAGWAQVGHELLDRLGWRAARSGADSENAKARIGVLSPAFLFPASVLAVIALSTWHLEGMKPARKAAGLALALLVAGAMWPIAMREHAFVHAYTVLLFLPGIAATIGALVTFGWWQRRWQPRGAPVRVAGAVAGCVLLIAHVSQMRHAHVLNLGWKLDAAVHERNLTIEKFESRFIAARPAFADVQRMYMYSHDAQLGRKLHVAFDNDTGRMHIPLAKGEAQMLDWRGVPRAMLDGQAGAGPPRFLAEPASHLAFFFPGRQEIEAGTVALGDGSRVSRLWMESTLDSAGVIVGAAVEAPAGKGTAGLVLHARVRDAAGTLIWKRTALAEQCAAVTDSAVIWINLIEPPSAEGREIEVWFTRAGGGRSRLRIDEGTLKLPDGIRLAVDGRSLLLRAAKPPVPAQELSEE